MNLWRGIVSTLQAIKISLNSLEDDVEVVFRANESLVLDDARVIQALKHRDLVRKLLDLLLALALEKDSLNGDDATRVEVESAVDGAELAATDALAELLKVERSTRN